MIVNTLPPVDLSGVGEQVLQLAHGLEELGHEVEILGRGGRGARGPKLLFPLTVIGPALRAVARFGPDVVQVHESDGALAALALSLRRRRGFVLCALQQVSYWRELRAVRPLRDRGGPVLARPVFRERLFQWLRAPLLAVLGRLSARRCDVVLAPSRQTARELEEDYGVSQVAVVPNATGAPLPGRERQRGAGNLEVATEGATPGRLLFVGRLRIRKGVEILLEALARLAERGVAVPLDVVGDGERLVALQTAVARLGLTTVTFCGRRGPAEIHEMLERAAALVVPSTYEGMPLVVLEAMSAACPVVATRVSGIPEVVADGDSGWLVDAEDVEQLTQALAAMVSDPELSRARGSRGRAILEERYRPSHVARRWQLHLEPAVEARRSAAGGGVSRA